MHHPDGEDRGKRPGGIERVEPRAVAHDAQRGEAELRGLHHGDRRRVGGRVDQVVHRHFQRRAGHQQPGDAEADQMPAGDDRDAEHRSDRQQRPEGARDQCRRRRAPSRRTGTRRPFAGDDRRSVLSMPLSYPAGMNNPLTPRRCLAAGAQLGRRSAANSIRLHDRVTRIGQAGREAPRRRTIRRRRAGRHRNAPPVPVGGALEGLAWSLRSKVPRRLDVGCRQGSAHRECA